MGAEAPPKALLSFGGKSLLARHLAILDACGVRQIAITIGYRAADLRDEVARHERGGSVVLIENPSLHDGSIVSLWHGRDVLRSGMPIPADGCGCPLR
jgi:choline kinase